MMNIPQIRPTLQMLKWLRVFQLEEYHEGSSFWQRWRFFFFSVGLGGRWTSDLWSYSDFQHPLVQCLLPPAKRWKWRMFIYVQYLWIVSDLCRNDYVGKSGMFTIASQFVKLHVSCQWPPQNWMSLFFLTLVRRWRTKLWNTFWKDKYLCIEKEPCEH